MELRVILGAIPGVVWRASAVAFYEILQSLSSVPPHQRQNVRILELGSGTGILGIALARLGFGVVLTDISEWLCNIRENVCANLSNENGDLLCACCSGNRKCSLNARVHVCELFWGEEPLSENLDAFSQGFHLIVASDVVYWVAEDIFAEDTLQPLLKTTLQYLKKGCSVEAVDSIVSSKAIIAFECRDPTREKSFLTLVNESLEASSSVSTFLFDTRAEVESETKSSDCFNLIPGKLVNTMATDLDQVIYDMEDKEIMGEDDVEDSCNTSCSNKPIQFRVVHMNAC